MNRAILMHHLGLGDHFICNGLVREFVRRHGVEHCFLPCKIHNLTSVGFMYRDLVNVTPVPVRTFHDVGQYLAVLECPLVKAGFEKARTPDWDVSFYDSVGIPISCRWDSFYVQRDERSEKQLIEKLNPAGKPYILVHNESSTGRYELQIGSELQRIHIEKEQTRNLFDYCRLIENADEIHCIDSSFVHLVESIGTTANCHFHAVKDEGYNEFARRLDWKRVSY